MSAHAEPAHIQHGHGAAHADDHAHGHDEHVAHHFEDAHQQLETHTLGMWTFLATEIMFFGGLFLAFTVYHIKFPEAFTVASKELNVWFGGVNTFFLILSSFTMALAVHAAQTNHRKRLLWNLVFTIALACCFMVVKYFEWTEKYHHGIIPGFSNFQFPPVHHGPIDPKHEQLLAAAQQADPNLGRHAAMFFVLYFVMTGLHGIHVAIGIGLLAWIWWRAKKREFNERWYTPVELTGLYWHLVDLIWIYLFPLIYLIHRY